ncbi:Gfo/Idh/MocA family protein [Novosphingobium colocasiae]|uniref:Gfo/Idh/MocA family protein n=1 Tax=Novosphingobium colocasiae TaxID=1256513 RepID=UPI001E5910F2|nr:Gfo/Idh/MocA family oxidoreductase [Novosphingobium colocasiae]
MPANVAVVGLGKMGLSHLAVANALEHLKVVAICDSSEVVGRILQKYTQIPFIANYEKLLDLPGLQGVIIATPTTAHDWMVRKAIDKGLHVFCEKPLTLSSAQSRSLGATAAAKGLVAQVGYHNRFIGTFREVKRLLDAGAIGTVSHIQGQAYGPVVLKRPKPSWRAKAGGGGCLYDYAAHPINLMNWFLGTPETCNGAFLKSGFSAEVDDEVYATLGFACGATGQISVNWSDHSVRKMSTRIAIWGTSGIIHADRQEIQTYLTGTTKTPPDYKKGWTVRYITELTPPVTFYLRGEEYSAQLESFSESIVKHKISQQNSFHSSAETDETIEMIRAAAESGGTVGTYRHHEAMPRRAGFVGRMMGR